MSDIEVRVPTAADAAALTCVAEVVFDNRDESWAGTISTFRLDR